MEVRGKIDVGLTLLDGARAHGMTEGTEGWMLLTKWLEHKPDQELLEAQKNTLNAGVI